MNEISSSKAFRHLSVLFESLLTTLSVTISINDIIDYKKVAYISRVSYRLSVSERECLVYTICNLRNCEIEYLMSFMT